MSKSLAFGLIPLESKYEAIFTIPNLSMNHCKSLNPLTVAGSVQAIISGSTILTNLSVLLAISVLCETTKRKHLKWTASVLETCFKRSSKIPSRSGKILTNLSGINNAILFNSLTQLVLNSLMIPYFSSFSSSGYL
ncbi:hypothetical protein WICPIJ_004870 [Wickerhamomyces pijperi]|uniref:Uncharacterized protein n=1 Tax=Wickerhamomyces pijperi TaxID=599730 RepID=A0A9P8TMG9_WICPI|nr:hypothetical protein WICPIJ_004870 [Wickerhamomyces pijperi]